MVYEKYGKGEGSVGGAQQSGTCAQAPPMVLEEVFKGLADQKDHIGNIREKAGGLAAYLVGYIKEAPPDSEKTKSPDAGALNGILDHLRENKRVLTDISRALEAILRQTEPDR